MKSTKLTAFALLTLLTLACAGSAFAADDEIQKLREEGKANHAAHVEEMKKHHEELKQVRETYISQMTDLKKQREEAIKAGNKDQAAALQKQIRDLKKERHDKFKDARSEMKAARHDFRGEKKAFHQKVKEARQKN